MDANQGQSHGDVGNPRRAEQSLNIAPTATPTKNIGKEGLHNPVSQERFPELST